MLSLITPHLQLNSILELTSNRFRKLGRPGLLLDIDCTLKDHGAADFAAPVLEWIEEMKQEKFRLCLVSNGRPKRVSAISELLGVPFIAKAFKPFPFGCRAALRVINLGPEQTAFVGDQIFADVLAGRLAGLFTILVRPTSTEEPWFTRIKRPFERQVLRRLAAKNPNDLQFETSVFESHAS